MNTRELVVVFVFFLMTAPLARAGQIVSRLDAALTNAGFERVSQSFDTLSSRVSLGDLDYSSSGVERLKVNDGIVLSVANAGLVLVDQKLPFVEFSSVSDAHEAYPLMKQYACHSGYVNEFCGGFTEVLRDSLSAQSGIQVFVANAVEGRMSYGFVLIHDSVNRELLLLFSGFYMGY
ncbi:MAG TPA: hypothetical protein VJB59_05865 [Bdellovibrionota bacterium]|nr:hypothetical protein [Bdellovibrionota bacterium]